jgi:hypothetical protein
LTFYTRCADVALVLAIDASGSISDADFYMQTAGYYAALNHPEVLVSLKAAGTVDLAAVFWADSAYQPQVIGWQRIEEAADARTFAQRLVGETRKVSGNTDIGMGINAALDLFAQPGRCADRAIIDISGDGRASVLARRSGYEALAPARKRALDMGVVINALAITNRDARLGDYYTRYVAGGIGSFVMEVDGFETFHKAITQKLVRELLSEVMREQPKGQVPG